MMPALATIFDEFRLPNATTWFYFSLLLAVALFFKFSRFLSVRNWDVLTLFLLVPGLLLLQEANSLSKATNSLMTGENLAATKATLAQAVQLRWLGYLWLLCGSGYFLIRCLVDLALVRRPALSPNLNLSGLAWLGGALLVCLASVAVRHPQDPIEVVGKESAYVKQTERQLGHLVNNQAAVAETPDFDTHFWVGCTLAMMCHLAVVAGLLFVGCRHFQDAHAGMAAATFYLLLPYTALHVGQWHHLWPTALLVWTVAAYRKPVLAGLLLGLAAGTMYFPALVFPVWFSFYWRRGACRFTSSFALSAGLSLAVVGIIVWLQGDLENIVRSTFTLSDWQPWKEPTTDSFWRWIDDTGVQAVYRIPLFIAYLAFVLTTAFWPAPKNLAHVLALAAAVFIGIQFWYADQGGVYVLWYLPLLLLMVFRPNLSERRPLPIATETDWVARLGRALGSFLLRLLKVPEPLVRVR